MKPTVNEIFCLDDGLQLKAVQQHLSRLPEDYFKHFSNGEIACHVRLLQDLNSDHPVATIVSDGENGTIVWTVLAFDYASEFSVISGLLAAYGFSILSGNVFTYARTETPAVSSRRRQPRFNTPDLLRRRRIIDRFILRNKSNRSASEQMSLLGKRLAEVIRLLEEGSAKSSEEARRIVNNAVTVSLGELTRQSSPVLYPMDISMTDVSSSTATLRVVSQDTPAFLYALSIALSLQGLSIERVRIRTVRGRVEDTIEISDRSERSLTDKNVRERIQLSVLLTKQFTFFLPSAPDPYKALSRYWQLVQDIIAAPNRQDWLEIISGPRTMRDLARLLGASDFLWEDFIRLQYESLLPILQPPVDGTVPIASSTPLRARLDAALASCTTTEERLKMLNQFKDREIFLIDLDHILQRGMQFSELARRLTALAELVVEKTAGIIWEILTARHGHPRTVGGLPAHYAVMGLGKLGGIALGYASDIELLFVYSDNGSTDGEHSISNAEFFCELARLTAKSILAKREGIFEVDLRLRPYGHSGPLACSLENFCKYYGPGGPALSYERLALVRMRTIAGDHTFGTRLERLRDEFVYRVREIKLEDIHKLRARQATEKNKPGRFNAKFSPGALVDLEYTVQLLQVEFGAEHDALRTPQIHQALAGLREAGILDAEEQERLVSAYGFARRLINGLRMLRGSARDLFLPEIKSDEYMHLARRMGYEEKDGLSPSEQLHLDVETRTAAVRAFVEKHYGRKSLPGSAGGNIADVLLSSDRNDPAVTDVLKRAGFRDAGRAFSNLHSLAGRGRRREVFLSLAVLACDHLKHEPAPDMALNNWDRFVSKADNPLEHFQTLLSQPKRLDILLGIFSRSQFLADSLIRYPGFLSWVTDPVVLQRPRSRETLIAELAESTLGSEPYEEWPSAVCRFRRREILRIGTRDMILKAPIEEITGDLSALADAVLEEAIRNTWRHLMDEGHIPSGYESLVSRFFLIGLGKLGAEELNYSSDIDLIAGFEPFERNSVLVGKEREILSRLLNRLCRNLTRHTSDGYAYRIDFRLRPYGSAGEQPLTTESMKDYYKNKAALWEIQTLLKSRIVAGSRETGDPFLKEVRSLLSRPLPVDAIVSSICSMRKAAIQQITKQNSLTHDVKTGIGGIRDIEFLVQGYQLSFAYRYPDILVGNTLQALRLLGGHDLLSERTAGLLAGHYVFLRRVEHFLQILENRQIHEIPAHTDELNALAKRLSGTDAKADNFLDDLSRRTEEVREIYTEELNRLNSYKKVI
jgi:glutamate-ammonia-ligase adenylyltransferase